MPSCSRRFILVAWLIGCGCLVSVSGTGASAAEDWTVRAKLEIGAMVAQYSYRWDSKDSEAFADLFTDDGVMERRVFGEVVTNSRVVGRPAIFEYAKGSHQGRLADRQTRHHMSALIFLELTEDSAITENMALITHQRANEAPFISGSGIYRNTWRRTEQGWKIASRILFSDRFPGP